MRRLNGYSETWLEKHMAAGLTSRGLLNFHMSDPTKPGIPDRYVVGGVWIEVKQGESFKELERGFDRQRTFLDKLERYNDTTLICALFQPNNYTAPKLFVEPWRQWKLRETKADRGWRWDCDIDDSPYEIKELTDLEKGWVALERMVRV